MCPSISTSLSKSTLAVNVEAPDTLTVPLTSSFALGLKVDIPTLLLNVEIPETFNVPLTSSFARGSSLAIPTLLLIPKCQIPLLFH